MRKTCFILIVWCLCSKCEDVFFMIKKYDPEGFFCVTNSSSALTWIEDTAEVWDQGYQVSEFIPRHQSDYHPLECQNTDYQRCVTTVSDEPILDRRWEEFTVHRSDYLEDEKNLSAPLMFTTILNISDINFDIPLSIRVSSDAHIFLCEGGNVRESSCYWLLLQAYGGGVTALRKCPKKTIPAVNGIEHNCEEMQYVRNFRPYLTNDAWNHFLLSKTTDQLSFTQIGGRKSQILIDCYDGKSYSPTRMIVHTKNDIGLWKIHEMTHSHVIKESTTSGVSVVVNNGTVCFAMFIKTCNFCKMTLEYRFGNETLKSQVFGPETKWKEIQFAADSIKYEKVYLKFTYFEEFSNDTDDTDPFWSASNFVPCYNTDYRMITLYRKATCQLMSGLNIILTEDDTELSESVNTCDENTVGESCTPCSWFLKENECGQLKITEEHDGLMKYTCSAGYKFGSGDGDQSECSAICDPGLYGHGCQHKCGRCSNSECHSVNGICTRSSCNDDYGGSKCDTAPTPSNLKWLSFFILVVPIAAVVIYMMRWRKLHQRKNNNGGNNQESEIPLQS